MGDTPRKGGVGGGMALAGGRFSDLLSPQFQRRDGCRVPFAVTRLPYCVCDPLLPTNQPASGALPTTSPRRVLETPSPGWLRRDVAKSVPFKLALQSNVAPFHLFSPPSSQTPYSQNCPFASHPPVPAPSMQLCLRSLGALRCAYCRGRPMRRPSTLKKRKRKEKEKQPPQVLSFCGQRKGAPRVLCRRPSLASTS